MIDLAAVRRAVDPKYRGKGSDVRCPVHADSRPSLSINLTAEGKLVCHCHAGCDQRAVWEAVRQRAGHLLNGAAYEPRAQARRTIYEYTSADGEVLLRVHRVDHGAPKDKDFYQQSPDGKGGWHWHGLQGATPLFRLDALAANPQATVVVVEGEKAALAAQRLLGAGYVATTWPGGGRPGAVEQADFGPLAGRSVVVWPDADAVGAKAAERVVARLKGIARLVRIVDVAGLADGADAADVSWSVAEFEARLREPGQTEAAGAAPLDWIALSEREPPPRDWLCEPWLTGGVTLFAGRGGIGKSLLAQQWATALALGRDFVGKVARARRGLLWNCEDDHNELWRRQLAICSAFGVSLRELRDRLHVVPRAQRDNLMMTITYGAPAVTDVVGELAAQAAAVGADFVVLDNVACVFAANGNDPAHVRLFVNATLRALEGRPLLLVGHPAKTVGSEYAGSMQWEAAARTRLYLGTKLPDQQDDDEPADDGVVILSRRKANYSPRDWLRLNYVDGAFVCATPSDSGESGFALRQMQARRVVLHGFDRLVDMGKQPTDTPQSPEYLPKLLIEHKLAEDLSRRTLAAAMRDLMTEGKFRIDVVGQWRNRQPKKGLVKT